MSSKYDLEAVRKKLREQEGGFKDPAEFRPPKAENGAKPIRYRFYILPPLHKGDKCADGVASASMETFAVPNGSHKVNNKFYACPRLHDSDDCALCEFGFDLINETDDKKKRSAIARQWLPRGRHAVNIYFPPTKTNPEDLRGNVMWMNVSKQVYDVFEACIYNDDPGDPEDPQACGVFFDEMDAYLFQLEVIEKGGYNNYEKSRFLANVGKKPIVTKDGKAVKSKIQKVLDQRHDLFTKFDDRDPETIDEVVRSIKSGDADDAGFDDDETQDEAVSEDTDDTVDAVDAADDAVDTDAVDDAVDTDAVDVVDDTDSADLDDDSDSGDDSDDLDDSDDDELKSLLDELEDGSEEEE